MKQLFDTKIDEACLVALSGGLDSTVLAYVAKRNFREVHAMGANYGQRHIVEQSYAALTCKALGIPSAHQYPFDLRGYGKLVTNSTLTNRGMTVAEHDESKQERSKNVVPMRNTMFLSGMAALASARGIKYIAIAPHADDADVYPDCRPNYYDAFRSLLEEALPDDEVNIFTPFLESSKADLVRLGEDLGVNWENTYTCYKGGDIHCGECPACVQRRLAFAEADVKDPTKYAVKVQL